MIPGMSDMNLTPRDVSKWADHHCLYKDRDSFFATNKLDNGVHSILLGNSGQIFDLFLSKVNSPNLLITFSGAIDASKRAQISLPVFSGIGIAKGLDYSVLSIADPSLALAPDLGLAWYAGSRGINLPNLIVHTIRHVAKVLGSESIFLLGGSGGGFAALNASERISNSTVICMNPQTDIAAYYKSMVNKFTRACFGKNNFNLIPEEYKIKHRTNLLDIYKKTHNNNILYFQNISDKHLIQHATPFARVLGYTGEIAADRIGVYKLTNKATLFVGNWGDGHIPLPKSRLRSLLKHISQKDNRDDTLQTLIVDGEWLITPEEPPQ